jgi:hypothetical protein
MCLGTQNQNQNETIRRTIMALVKPAVAEKEDIVVEATTEDSPSQELAIQQSSEVVIQQPREVSQLTGTKALLEEQAALGFEGIEVSQFSFDRVVLDDGKFQKGEEEIGDKFKFLALSTRPIYIIKQDTSQDSEMYYSYCPQGSTMADGSSAKAIRDAWKEEGFDCEDNPIVVLTYLEIMAQLLEENGEAGDIVCLSIPPSSRARFGQVPMMAKLRFGANTNEVVVEASVGAKVGTGQKSFRPWNFKVISRA